MNSMASFNSASEANEMLKGLRYFEKASKLTPEKKALSWGEVSSSTDLSLYKKLAFARVWKYGF